MGVNLDHTLRRTNILAIVVWLIVVSRLIVLLSIFTIVSVIRIGIVPFIIVIGWVLSSGLGFWLGLCAHQDQASQHSKEKLCRCLKYV